jgi:hypothetical protein
MFAFTKPKKQQVMTRMIDDIEPISPSESDEIITKSVRCTQCGRCFFVLSVSHSFFGSLIFVRMW